jgi:hypothetical protein
VALITDTVSSWREGAGVQANSDHIKGLGWLAAESVLADNV